MAALWPHFTVNDPCTPENVHVYCDICVSYLCYFLFKKTSKHCKHLTLHLFATIISDYNILL